MPFITKESIYLARSKYPLFNSAMAIVFKGIMFSFLSGPFKKFWWQD